MLSWPAAASPLMGKLPDRAEGEAEAAAAKLLWITGLSTGVGVTLRPDLALSCASDAAAVKVGFLTTCCSYHRQDEECTSHLCHCAT